MKEQRNRQNQGQPGQQGQKKQDQGQGQRNNPQGPRHDRFAQEDEFSGEKIEGDELEEGSKQPRPGQRPGA